jgi:hypothetical protein
MWHGTGLEASGRPQEEDKGVVCEACTWFPSWPLEVTMPVVHKDHARLLSWPVKTAMWTALHVERHPRAQVLTCTRSSAYAHGFFSACPLRWTEVLPLGVMALEGKSSTSIRRKTCFQRTAVPAQRCRAGYSWCGTPEILSAIWWARTVGLWPLDAIL